MSSETLAAATLLQMYEHSRGGPYRYAEHMMTEQAAWVIHANGVIRLLQIKGPQAIRDDIDRSVLRAEVGNIFFQAIRNRQECFLADSQWWPLLQPATVFPDQGVATALSLLAAMTVITVHLPGKSSGAEYSRCLSHKLIIPNKFVGLLCGFERVQHKSGSATALVTGLLDLRPKMYECWSRYNVLQPDTTDLNASRSNAAERITKASRFAICIFLVCINHMLIDTVVLYPKENYDDITTSDLEYMAEECEKFALLARPALDELLQADCMAAQNTISLFLMILGRIKHARQYSEVEVPGFLGTVEELYTYLRQRAETD